MYTKTYVGGLPSSLLLLKISCLLLVASVTYCNAILAPEQTAILNAINVKRAAEGASNMQLVVWNATLAKAVKTASTCDGSFSSLADQNIGYTINTTTAVPSSKINFNAIVTTWFNQKANYSYSLAACNDGQTCDAYLQLAWSEVNQIGCDYYNCTDAGTTNLVCYFNAVPSDTVPYLKGSACSNCSSGVFFCTPTGLCDKSCKVAGGTCVCKAACKNCGTQTSACTCQCQPGWQGLDCSGPCNDTSTACATDGVAAFCANADYPWVPDFCPALCGICAPSTCPIGYTYNATTGSCYFVGYQPATRSQAQQKCQLKSARLAYIESADELDVITSLWQTKFPVQTGQIPAWIAGCRKNFTHDDPETSFVWSTGCTQAGAPATGTSPMTAYNKWATDEPNNIGYDPKVAGSGESCVELFNAGSGYAWNDVSCSAVRSFYICEAAPVCPPKTAK